MLVQWSNEFQTLCQSQMEKGAEYETDGLPGWMQNDLFRYMYEEMADLSNYAQLMFFRIRVAQEVYIASGVDSSFQPDVSIPDELPHGAGAFASRSGLPSFFPKGGGS